MVSAALLLDCWFATLHPLGYKDGGYRVAIPGGSYRVSPSQLGLWRTATAKYPRYRVSSLVKATRNPYKRSSVTG